jgi:hypothetical protein
MSKKDTKDGAVKKVAEQAKEIKDLKRALAIKTMAEKQGQTCKFFHLTNIFCFFYFLLLFFLASKQKRDRRRREVEDGASSSSSNPDPPTTSKARQVSTSGGLTRYVLARLAIACIHMCMCIYTSARLNRARTHAVRRSTVMMTSAFLFIFCTPFFVYSTSSGGTEGHTRVRTHAELQDVESNMYVYVHIVYITYVFRPLSFFICVSFFCVSHA